MEEKYDSKSLRMCRSFLGKTVNIVIDQAFGTKYEGTIYEQNYGYVPNTIAPDGDGLDAYFIGPQKPLEIAVGKCIAIVHRLEDDDDKLILVEAGVEMTDEEIEKAVHFREQYFKHVIIRQ